ncbi:uncharacterized protein K441DRAFT_255669 [Cenococcum geophilum 1.58]|uniref:uncharacterized protein n=1 Tax=Cenococcum geophilum 1.58 TaxID=794803 RepID=UPI00358F29FB|nr:hypothetical protein K441DRAFT_255669 [Cenococcum geophilum 1.58]
MNQLSAHCAALASLIHSYLPSTPNQPPADFVSRFNLGAVKRENEVCLFHAPFHAISNPCLAESKATSNPSV